MLKASKGARRTCPHKLYLPMPAHDVWASHGFIHSFIHGPARPRPL